MTRRAELAVKALGVLGGPAVTAGRMKATTLAAALDSSAGFVNQVVGPLVHAGWVRSEPGPTGGYVLQADLHDISVLAVIEAVDGPTDNGRCIVSDRACGSDPCVLHTAWARSRAELMRSLDGTSVADIVPAVAVRAAGGEP